MLVQRAPWRRQPQSPVRVDPGNPLTADLRPLVVYAGGYSLFDSVTNRPFTRGSASVVFPASKGLGARQIAVNTGLSLTAQSGIISPGYTAIWAGVIHGTASGSTPKILGIASSTTSQSSDLIGVEIASSTQLTLTFKSGAAFGTRNFAGLTAWAAGDVVTIVATYDVPDAKCRLAIALNGQISSYESSAIGGAAAPTLSGTETIVIGPDVIENASRYANATALLAVITGGAAPLAAMREIARNPWQIFAPQKRTIWIPSAATPGGFLAAWAHRPQRTIGAGVI